jgi:hypothetical protein
MKGVSLMKCAVAGCRQDSLIVWRGYSLCEDHSWQSGELPLWLLDQDHVLTFLERMDDAPENLTLPEAVTWTLREYLTERESHSEKTLA